MGSGMLNTIEKNKVVGYWLMIGVFMIIIQTILGGITRLSGSGLSITEWNIVTGTLPPLNHSQWLQEFAKYKQTPQFRLLNADFTLSDFQFIFFWEWFHRIWARFLGVVFLIPFVYFLIKKYFTRDMLLPFVGMFILGALQGAIGWIMVASGLTGDAIYVRPTKLAMHFIFAMILACYVFWFAFKLLTPARLRLQNRSLKTFVIIILFLLFFQLIYGALMAGYKAAPAAATWPTINGEWIPKNLGVAVQGYALIDNVLTIHFIHRLLAYLITLMIILYTLRAAKIKRFSFFNRRKYLPLLLVIVQVLLGIISLQYSIRISADTWGVFETLALLHQTTAMLLMLSLLLQVFYLSKKRMSHA